MVRDCLRYDIHMTCVSVFVPSILGTGLHLAVEVGTPAGMTHRCTFFLVHDAKLKVAVGFGC